jgi:hypothetical protein
MTRAGARITFERGRFSGRGMREPDYRAPRFMGRRPRLCPLAGFLMRSLVRLIFPPAFETGRR